MNNQQTATKTEAICKPDRSSNQSKLDFLTPTITHVLEFFLNDPSKQYYGREVSRKTCVSIGSANKILRLLTELGFLLQERKGNIIMYTVNLEEPAVKQFKILINVFALRDLVNKLKLDSRKVVLFGSCSQGTDTTESDIDLLIITSEKENIKKTIRLFNSELKRQVAPIIVDMNQFVQLKKEDKPLYENIERGIVLWEAE